jgi:hypothetical protein
MQVQNQHHLAVSDFPNPKAFSRILGTFGLDKIQRVTDKHIKIVNEALQSDIPRLVKQYTNPY